MESVNSSVGIVIPTYNEGATFSQLLEAVRKQVPGAKIVVVDDSVTLETVEAVKAFAAHDNLVQVIHRDSKGGRGSAILVGLKKLADLGCTTFLEMDADFSHPPEQIPELISTLRDRHLDLLIGSRYLPQSAIVNWPLTRRVFSKCSNFLARFMLGIPIHDYTNGYRCYSSRAVAKILSTCGVYGKGFIALSEILVNIYYSGEKMQVGEIPTRFINRVRGESSVNHREITNALVGLFQIYGLKRKLQARGESSEPRLEESRR